ncbi:MAG: hypothetical protein PWQ94_520 [Thermoanaerobacterium sp.]|nr:hypothetical protein [Thermoanaerobacterium sp.]
MHVRKLYIVISVFIMLCILIFLVISDVTSETNMVISKVKSGLNAGLNDFLLNAPRTKVNANGSYGNDYIQNENSQSFYYVPNGNNQSLWIIVYKDLLINLNQDESFPLCKVTSVVLDSDLDTVLDATATVNFQILLGFSKTIYVHQEIRPLPHFKHMTGMDKI